MLSLSYKTVYTIAPYLRSLLRKTFLERKTDSGTEEGQLTFETYISKGTQPAKMEN